MNFLKNVHTIVFLLIPFSLCFVERANTFLLLLYGAKVLLQPHIKERFRKIGRQKWVLPFLILYLLHLLSIIWSSDLEMAQFVLEKKASLLLLPVIIVMDSRLTKDLMQKVMASLLFACLLAIWICFFYALWRFWVTGESALFFYHSFSWLLDEFNAIYFSFYIFFSLTTTTYLIRNQTFTFLSNRWLQGFIYLTLLFGLLFLSSRLFIVLSLIYLVFHLLKEQKVLLTSRNLLLTWIFGVLLLVSSVTLVGFTRARFDHLFDAQFEVLQQKKFSWDTPFNGLTLRLLFLKFGWEILSENGAYLGGVGVGDAQNQMNEIILKYNLYHGNPNLGDTGYLDYNFHNQYMELWVQIGLFGVLCWLWLLWQGFEKGLHLGWNAPLIYLLIGITTFSIFEGVIERQRGVVFITFFLSTIYSSMRK